MNLCILSEDHPQCNVPRKAIKACQGKGQALSPWESGLAVPFPPRDSVVRVNLSHLSHKVADTVGQCPQHCVWDETNSHRLPSPVEEKGRHSHSLKRRAPQPLPWQAFIAFLGTLPGGWSSFTMHRFTLGGYLLQKTKERMLLITSKRKGICKCKGKSGWTGYTCPWKV